MKSIRRKVAKKQVKSNNLPIEPKFAHQNYNEIIKDYFSTVKSKGDYDRSFYSQDILIKPVIIDENNISYPKTIKKSVYDLITYTKKRFRLPEDCVCQIHFSYAMRCAKTEYKPPDEKTVMRLILNYNNNDLYKMSSSVSIPPGTDINLGLSERSVYMKSNTLTALGPAPLCLYHIIVNGPPRFKIPTENGGERTTIKPHTYKRLTAIIDFYISKQFARDIDEHLKSFGDQNGPNQKYINIVKRTLLQMIRQDSIE